MPITKIGVSTRRKKEKKCFSTLLLVFNQRLKNTQKVSPINDNLNKQDLQVLKHFEKETFKYPDAKFTQKQPILDLATVKKLEK